MAIFMMCGRRAAGLALTAFIATISFGCGGTQGPPATADRASASPQQAPPASAPAGTPPPLVDSRGNLVPVAGGAAPQAAAAGGELDWTVPQGWVTETPSSSMRKAQYALPAAGGDSEGGQCAVFYFGPGQGGDIQSNVDRWASQLTTASGGHPAPAVTESSVAGRKVLKVSMEGTYASSPMMGGDTTPKPGTLLLGAIVEGSDANWFFKCTGPKKTMESRRKEFDSLIESIHSR